MESNITSMISHRFSQDESVNSVKMEEVKLNIPEIIIDNRESSSKFTEEQDDDLFDGLEQDSEPNDKK